MRIEGTEADLCLKCMGMWFEAGELSRASGLKITEAPTGSALAGARRTPYRCPSCAVPLYERELDPGSEILIDQCPRCSGLFLDRDEFGRAQSYFRAKGAPRLKRRRPTEPPRRPVYTTASDIDEDGTGAVLFQFMTGLPLEVGMATTIFPFLTVGLLLVNTAAFVLAATEGLRASVFGWGLVPSEVLGGHRLYTFLTSMFMHGGVMHLVGNMYFLYLVGDNLEERLGRLKLLGLYLLCGLMAGVAHVVGNPHSTVPAVGASGAISGLIAAYAVFFPRARFVIRWFWFFWYHVKFGVPAWGYFVFWVLLQVFFASLGLPGVAWWAHVGGFACGIAVACFVRWHEMQQKPLQPARR